MKIKIGAAQSLLIACKQTDSNEKTILKMQTRIDLAININRLHPIVESYERARQRTISCAANGATAISIVQEASIMTEDAAARDSEIEIELKTIEMADLKLEDNQRISIQTIQMLAPIIKDFDAG